MPAPGKEFEQPRKFDEIASREIEGYMDRVEKQVETQQQAVQNQQSPQLVITPNPVQDMGQIVSAQVAHVIKPKIILPLNKSELERGLHLKIYDGVKWLSEWCLMMIKKYPGRVFYSPTSEDR